MDVSGTVIANLGAGLVTDAAGNNNTASTSSTNVINYVDSVAPTVDITKFVVATGQTALIEGTAGISPGDGSTVTIVLCTSQGPNCSAGNTKATLTATASATTGAWSVTSGNLGAGTFYARAKQTDLSNNTGTSSSASLTIP
jgi:hypothetical protein